MQREGRDVCCGFCHIAIVASVTQQRLNPNPDEYQYGTLTRRMNLVAIVTQK